MNYLNTSLMLSLAVISVPLGNEIAKRFHIYDRRIATARQTNQVAQLVLNAFNYVFKPNGILRRLVLIAIPQNLGLSFFLNMAFKHSQISLIHMLVLTVLDAIFIDIVRVVTIKNLHIFRPADM